MFSDQTFLKPISKGNYHYTFAPLAICVVFDIAGPIAESLKTMQGNLSDVIMFAKVENYI